MSAPKDLMDYYRECRLCPRNCGVNRLVGERGYCGETAQMRLAWAGLHRGEEPPISGSSGGGTLFFSGCSLHCGFCQNRQLSRGEAGRRVLPEELAEIMVRLQNSGAKNINIVTGTHFVPGILKALEEGERRGLDLPMVWNSSGYETEEAVKLLRPKTALWLPDLKTLDPSLAVRLFGASDYPGIARSLILGLRNSGDQRMSGREIFWDDRPVRLIVRHLILPGLMENTRKVLEFFREIRGEGILISLMTQYSPIPGSPSQVPSRPLETAEAELAYRWLEELGIEEGFFQGPPEGENWLPDFTRKDPFPPGYAKKVWWWNE